MISQYMSTVLSLLMDGNADLVDEKVDDVVG